MPVESVAFRYHVDGLGQLNVEGFEEVHTTLFVDGDPGAFPISRSSV